MTFRTSGILREVAEYYRELTTMLDYGIRRHLYDRGLPSCKDIQEDVGIQKGEE